MPEPVDDVVRRLAVLRDGPAGVLAGPAAARARGDQRTRRRRTGLAAAALVLVAGALPVAAGLRGAGDERLDPPASAPTAPLQDRLLAPDDVARLQPGVWRLSPPGSTSPVLPTGCDAAAAVDGPDVALRELTGPARAYVRQHLVRYAGEQQAAAAFTDLRDRLAGCGGGARTTRLLPDVPGTSATRFYAERAGAAAGVPFAVERVGPVLSAVVTGAQRPSGPVVDLAALPPLADAAAARLRG